MKRAKHSRTVSLAASARASSLLSAYGPSKPAAPVKRLAAARRRLPAYYYAARTRFLYQAHGRAGLLAANLLWHLGRGIAQLRRLARKPVPGAIEAEARDIWTNFLRPLGDRRADG
jgi:hypothetical protein